MNNQSVLSEAVIRMWLPSFMKWSIAHCYDEALALRSMDLKKLPASQANTLMNQAKDARNPNQITAHLDKQGDRWRSTHPDLGELARRITEFIKDLEIDAEVVLNSTIRQLVDELELLELPYPEVPPQLKQDVWLYLVQEYIGAVIASYRSLEEISVHER